jgi:hypothetical protein
MENMRACPDCTQPQRWCDNPACNWPLPAGHWTHLSAEAVLSCIGTPEPVGTIVFIEVD